MSGESSGEAGRLIAAGVTRVEERDLARGLRLHPMNRRMLMGSAVLALGCWSYVALALLRGVPVKSWIVVVVLGIGTSYITYRVAFAGRILYRKWQEWQRQLRFEIAERRFIIRTEKDKAELDWEFCEHYWELDDLFVVSFRQGPRAPTAVYVLPKRAFQTAEEIDQVRATLLDRARPSRSRRGRSIVWHVVFWAGLCMISAAIYQLVMAR
jgi:hypothetical protein